MVTRFRFDLRKAIEVLLYIAEKCPDTYTALKVLYFADKEHLEKHGRFICGDTYIAMSAGPVPSGAYDIVKFARGDGFWRADPHIREAMAVEDYYSIVPKREPDLSFLSESDIECLDASIEEYGHLSFGELKRLSHDAAFETADRNDEISLDAIAKSLPDGEIILDYLRNS
jgi:uncharacterized phage-associated protein